MGLEKLLQNEERSSTKIITVKIIMETNKLSIKNLFLKMKKNILRKVDFTWCTRLKVIMKALGRKLCSLRNTIQVRPK